MILIAITFLLIGFFCLYLGAKFVVISLENISERFGVSQLLVGLVILSIGTSLPEIFVSLVGGIDKVTGIDPNIDGIVIGNKVGSFFTQITLILGILGLGESIFISKWELRREGTMMFVSVLIFFVCALDGKLIFIEALIMIGAYISYLYVVVKSEKKRKKAELEIKIFLAKRDGLEVSHLEDSHKPKKTQPFKKEIAFFIIGLVILLIGAELTLFSAHDLAKEIGVPEILVGILIVGLGTSLPELVADLTALKRNSNGIAIGDILGSNICDILLATSVGVLIVDFNVPPVILYFDIPVLLVAIGIALYFLWTKNSLKKREAVFLIVFYAVYAILRIIFFSI